MSNKKRIVSSVDVGKPEVLSEKHTIQASFHGFENLPHKKGDRTCSPEMTCHGHPWKIVVYPGGGRDTEDTDSGPSLSVFLYYEGAGHPKVNFTIRIGSAVKDFEKQDKNITFGSSRRNSGWKKFLLRRDVLDPTKAFLVNETLTVEADIQVWIDAPQTYTPRKRLRFNMEELLESGTEGDTCFTVGAKRFVVYKGLIARCAPVLGEMADSQQPPGRKIPINDVEPAIFETLLRFIYTDEPPKVMHDPREVLKVANRFGCSGLKLIAETEIVKAGIDAENAAELFMFADAHSCALLREAAREFCITHLSDIKNSAGWDHLKESTELSDEIVGASPTKFSETSYDTMRVATLRKKLDEKDLEVDGTRETLIRRLKEAAAKYRTLMPLGTLGALNDSFE